MEVAEGSAVTQVVGLSKGNTFSRSLYLPSEKASPDAIKGARKTLANYLTSIVGRARAQKERRYKMHTTTAFTSEYDVVVTGVIVIEPKRRDA